MVTRITDTGALPTTPPRAERSGADHARAEGQAIQPGAGSPEPAVRIQLSEASQLGLNAASTVSDEALVREIRQRIDAGQFRIDYEKVGEGILRDLIAQSVHRTQP